MYKILYITAVKKDLKSLPKEVRSLIDDKYFPALAENPYIGKCLKGEFKDYLSFSFSYTRVEYRIIYQILGKELLVLVIMVGSRENIYERLKRRR